VGDWSGWAIHVEPISGGVSGNYFRNLYLNNNTDSTCIGMIHYGCNDVEDVAVFDQVNVEWGYVSSGNVIELVNESAGVVFTGLHIEGVHMNQAESNFIYIEGTQSFASFNGVVLNNCDATADVSTRLAIYHLDSFAGQLHINGTNIRSDCDFSSVTGSLIGVYGNSSISNSLANGADIDVSRFKDVSGDSFTKYDFGTAADKVVMSKFNQTFQMDSTRIGGSTASWITSIAHGNGMFTTTATADTIVITGALATDSYLVQQYGSAAVDAQDILKTVSKADTLIVNRLASGTTGLTYRWWRFR